MTAHARLHVCSTIATLLLTLTAAGCAQDGAPTEETESAAMSEPQPETSAHVPQLLQNGDAVFGIFSGDKTPEQGAAMVENREADFVLYSLESGAFDIPTMEAYLGGMNEAAAAAGLAPHPVLLRTPPIHTDPDQIQDQVALALDAGAAGIVFPHVVDAAEAARSVELIRTAVPGEPNRALVDVLIVEDHQGMLNAREIMATSDLSVVFAGPGDLRRAYEGDMEKVESAIQAILAACLEFDVPCGVTAGAHDIAERLDQGFRVIIVTEPEALAVGRAHAGRTSMD